MFLPFLADTAARNLDASTIRKYRLLSREMREFAIQRNLKFLKQFDLPTLTEFRSTWQMNPLSSLKKLERLRAFFNFGLENKWVDENVARRIKRPNLSHQPTLPFTHDEMLRILAAVGPYVEQTAPRGRANAQRLRALVLVLQLCRKLPAKLLDPRARTRDSRSKQIWTGNF
jgi:site-specific recombinase XerD